MTDTWNKKATTLQVAVGDYLTNETVVYKVVETHESEGGTGFCKYMLEQWPSGRRYLLMWGDVEFFRLKKTSEEDAMIKVLGRV